MPAAPAPDNHERDYRRGQFWKRGQKPPEYDHELNIFDPTPEHDPDDWWKRGGEPPAYDT